MPTVRTARCRSRGRLSGQLDADQEAAFRTTRDMIKRLAVRTRDVTMRLAVRTARECLQTATDLTMRLSGNLTPDQEPVFQKSYILDPVAGFQNSKRRDKEACCQDS